MKPHENYYNALFAGDLAQMAEFYKLLPVTVNGARRYAAPEKIPILIVSSCRIKSGETIQTKTVLLMTGSAPDPEPGDLVAYSGKKQELIKVELCRSLSGEVVAIECTAM